MAERGERPGGPVPVSRLSGPRNAAREIWVEIPSAEGMACAWCYSDKRSYKVGERVNLHLSSNQLEVRLCISREGATPERVHQTGSMAASFHPAPERAYEQGCDWPVLSTWTIPADCDPGGYLVSIEDAAGAILGHHLFLVRPARPRSSALLLIAATSTWAAYNDWGGASHYYGIDPQSPRGRSPILSSRRPWARGQVWLPPDAPRAINAVRPKQPGAARYENVEWAFLQGYSKYYAIAGWASFERPFVVWAERNGYTVDIATQDDLHDDPALLDGYRCAVCVGHDEYWTREMRDHVDAFVDKGGRVARFAGNFFWQTRLDRDAEQQIAYKYDARTLDPVRATAPGLMTSAWEDPLVGHPGALTFGINGLQGQYAAFGGMARRSPRGFSVFRPEHWSLAGTGLAYGDMFGDEANIFGFEVDGLEYHIVDGLPEPLGTDGAPQSLQILAMGFVTFVEHGRAEDAASFMIGDGEARFRTAMLAPDLSDASVARYSRGTGMIVHFQRGKGEVFTAATCEWVNGLIADEFYTAKITRNVLDRFLAEP